MNISGCFDLNNYVLNAHRHFKLNPVGMCIIMNCFVKTLKHT